MLGYWHFLAKPRKVPTAFLPCVQMRSEEHTSELQSRLHLVCRLLLEKKKLIHHRDNQDTESLRPPRLHLPLLPVHVLDCMTIYARAPPAPHLAARPCHGLELTRHALP